MMQVDLAPLHITDAMRQAVQDVLTDGSFILGKKCAELEKQLAAYHDVKHCVLTSNWTMGVHMVYDVWGLQPGDEVIVPSHTAFPTIEPIIHHGATPVYVDIDKLSYLADMDEIMKAITPATKVICPVNLYGYVFDTIELKKRLTLDAKRQDIRILEDCAQSFGATYPPGFTERVGTLGDAGAFSFYPSKNLPTIGDGGCILTDNVDLADELRALRNHGRRSRYDHDIPGYNLRFNEVQAAFTLECLKNIEEWNAARRWAASEYRRQLSGIPGLVLPPIAPNAVYHLFVLYFSNPVKREEVQHYLKHRGVQTAIHYPRPGHRQPAAQRPEFTWPTLPQTEDVVQRILSIPIFPTIKAEQIDYVCSLIKECFR